jgi:S-adenosylmethionine synthetase
MARYVAKNIVAAGLAKRCTLQLSYAIGLVEPISIHVDTHGTGSVADESLASVIPKVFDLTPAGIINTLDLRRPIYSQTSAYGHFGRTDVDLTWERTDRIDALHQQIDLDAKTT